MTNVRDFYNNSDAMCDKSPLQTIIYISTLYHFETFVYVCMVIAYSRVWINRVRLPILLVVS